MIADPRGLLPEIGAIPPGGGRIVLPSGTEVVAEPVAHDAPELFLVHDGRAATRRGGAVTLPRPQLELRLLGDGQAGVRLDGVALRLRPRLVELLALLMLHRGRAGAEALCTELYGAAGHAGSVRVEMSRLRKLLPGAIEPGGYALICDVDADVKHVREALGRGAVGEAAAAYPGSLLPASQAPGIVSARKELDHWLRQAVITSDDPDALWAWVSAPAGSDDLLAWQRLLGALEYTDARRSLAAARVGDLRRRAAADRSASCSGRVTGRWCTTAQVAPVGRVGEEEPGITTHHPAAVPGTRARGVSTARTVLRLLTSWPSPTPGCAPTRSPRGWARARRRPTTCSTRSSARASSSTAPTAPTG